VWVVRKRIKIEIWKNLSYGGNMVLIIDNKEVTSTINIKSIHEDYPILKSNSTLVIDSPLRDINISDNYVYVGQREMAIVSSDDGVDMLGSEDATTCHIVVLRNITNNKGVTGLAHLDSDDPDQFLALESAVRRRSGASETDIEYEISIIGGYDDERGTSADITETLLTTIQEHEAKFQLKIACMGSINTVINNGVAWPRTYGAGVTIETGEVFCAKFSYHGPDTDIRSMWCQKGLHNIFDHQSGQIVIHPFEYIVWKLPELWIQQSDAFILKHCSTSPMVEPPTFCDHMRANFKRMITDPKPLDTIFPGGKSRQYKREKETGKWLPIV